MLHQFLVIFACLVVLLLLIIVPARLGLVGRTAKAGETEDEEDEPGACRTPGKPSFALREMKDIAAGEACPSCRDSAGPDAPRGA